MDQGRSNEQHDDQGLDRLAGFHKTRSEQLNARLEESPRFFWVLVGVSTAYGYVLWNVSSGQAQPDKSFVLKLASTLLWAALLWASWYLAALGYAFRFLQNCLHCIEHALGWSFYTPTGRNRPPGQPPAQIRFYRPGEVFWLLPGIYHAHVFGFVILHAMIGTVLWWKYHQVWIGPAACAIGVGLLFGINWWYVRKFQKTCKDPNQMPCSDPRHLVE